MSCVRSLIFRGKSKAIIIIIIKYIKKMISVEVVQVFGSFICDVFGSHLTKPPPIHYLNKFKYFKRPIKKNIFGEMLAFWEVCSFTVCTQYLVGAPFVLITASFSAWHGGDQFVALLRWYGSSGAMHINNQKFLYIYGRKFTKYLHKTWSLLNILMIFVKIKNYNFDPYMYFGYCYKYTPAM